MMAMANEYELFGVANGTAASRTVNDAVCHGCGCVASDDKCMLSAQFTNVTPSVVSVMTVFNGIEKCCRILARRVDGVADISEAKTLSPHWKYPVCLEADMEARPLEPGRVFFKAAAKLKLWQLARRRLQSLPEVPDFESYSEALS